MNYLNKSLPTINKVASVSGIGATRLLTKNNKNIGALVNGINRINSNNNVEQLNNNGNLTFKRGFFRILNQYERGVVFNLGKFHVVKEPGFRIVIPFFQHLELVDIRTFSYVLDKQEIISKDNISLIVDAVVFFKIVDPQLVVTKVGDCITIVKELAQVKIRELLSHNTLEQVLHNRDKFSNEIYDGLKEILDEYGVTVERINLKDIKFEESIIRAMAKRAEADQMRQAKIIYAQSEVQTAEQILAAAKILEKSPIAMRLKELDALQQIAKEKSSTVVYTPGNAFDIPKIPFKNGSGEGDHHSASI